MNYPRSTSPTKNHATRFVGGKVGGILGLLCAVAIGGAVSTPGHAATFNVTYTDGNGEGFFNPTFGAKRRAAFESALSYWAQKLGPSPAPINVTASFDPLGGSAYSAMLGYARPLGMTRDFVASNPAYMAGTYYPSALANHLAGYDLNTGAAEITATFNSDVDSSTVLGNSSFYYGLDARPSSSDFDFYSVALHEIAHGLGFTSLLDSSGTYSGQSFSSIYDRLLTQGNGSSRTRLIDMSNSGRLSARVSNNLYFDGNATRSANQGTPAKLYAPTTYEPGSSVSHLDEATYSTPNANELMTPIASGTTHEAGPVALAMLKDLGWRVGAVPVVSSIKRLDTNPTSAHTVRFEVAFDTPVSGVDSSDFTPVLTGSLSGASVISVSGSGSSYIVTVGNYSGPSGTIKLNVTDNDSITEQGGAAKLGGAGTGNGNYSGGESYTYAVPVPSVSLSAGPQTKEGDSGTTQMVFTVKLSEASASTVKVFAQSFQADTAPATLNTDYVALAKTAVTFNPGQVSQTVAVSVKGDTQDEENERIKLVISDPTGATLGTSSVEGTIVNDDTAPSISINDVSLNEGNSGFAKAVFTVSLSKASGKTITVSYATGPTIKNAALPDTDYTTIPATTLTFAPGQTQATVTVFVKGDILDEVNETFLVKLSSPVNATISKAVGTGTILDDDATPSLSVQATSAPESDGATGLPFVVKLSAASSLPVSVTVRPIPGKTLPATSGADYKTGATKLSFAPGETSKTFVVPLIDDSLDEDNERIGLELTLPVNAVVGSTTAEGIIVDDDGAPTVSINDISIREGNSATTNATFTLTLSGPSSREVRLAFTTFNKTAVSVQDYVATNGTIIFSPGETRKTIAVTINGDTLVESDEIFALVLSKPVNATLIKAVGLGTIVNDDSAAAPKAFDSGSAPSA